MADDALMFLSFSTAPGGVTPDLAGGRSGLLRGDARLAASGHDGSGLSLSGGGHVEVAHDAGFDLAAGALSFWLRPDAIGATQGLIGKDSRGIDGGELSVLLRWDGRISFRLESDSTTYKAISSRALEADEWAHVEVSWGRDGMQLRLDGAVSGSAAYTGGLSGNDESWVIGANAMNAAAGGATRLSGFFRGRIDEVTLSGPAGAGGGAEAAAAAGALSFAGQSGRGKVVDLARDFWADAPRVMPLGDSNTLGLSNVLPTAQLESYRGALWSRITADKSWIDYVGGRSNGPASLPDHDHLGVSGIRATTVISQAKGHASTYRPDVVLLMLGTNDALNEADAAATVPGDLMRIMQNLQAGAPGVTVLLSALPPIDPDAPGYSKRANADDIRDAINGQLSALAASARAQGIDAKFVAPSWNKSDLYDGVHLTAAGHAKLAAAWRAALEDGLSAGAFGGARTAAASIRDVTGSEAGDYLRGDGVANRLIGRGGADRIEGGAAADILTGGNGSDTFVFNAPKEGADRIADFRAADFIEISSAGFGGGLDAGDAALLRSGGNPAPQGRAGQFLYDRDDGRLFWDVDGSGPNARVLLATLAGAPALDADQLLIA